MALAFLALNGDGLGHLVRATIICHALEGVGERPVIFSQGIYPLDERTRIPGARVPSLWKADDATRRRVAADIQSFVEISSPAVLVEDTHPNPIVLPSRVRRVLIVRPTSFEDLCRLDAHYRDVYSAFLLADAPDSPTWPYSAEQTALLACWTRWHVIGPVYRAEWRAELPDVRRRYRLSDDQRLCVFSTGGGGRHRPNDGEAERFVAFAADVGRRLPNDTRLVFVCGPYFPPEVSVDASFEIVRHEEQMPGLLAAADGAAIRTGFNTTWECLASGTPLLPYIGKTFGEPMDERMSRLRDRGLLPQDVDQFWHDAAWRDRFRVAARQAVEQFPGVPDGPQLQRLILDSPQPRLRTARAARAAPSTRADTSRGTPLIVRIDDVVSLDPALAWVLERLAARQMRATIGVVPYLAGIDQQDLEAFDADGALFDVGQHGYAHVPRRGQDGGRYELDPDAAAPDPRDADALLSGMRQLERAFPARFTGGLSLPYDGLPRWLAAFWTTHGGRFVSATLTQRGVDRCAAIAAGVEVWDARRSRARDPYEILRDVGRQARRDGHGGLVICPRHLHSRIERGRVAWLLERLDRSGFRSASLREIVMAPAATSARPWLRSRLRAIARWTFQQAR